MVSNRLALQRIEKASAYLSNLFKAVISFSPVFLLYPFFFYCSCSFFKTSQLRKHIKNEAVDDERIVEQLYINIRSDAKIRSQFVEFYSIESEVFLIGATFTESEKEKIESLARQVISVWSVMNYIRVIKEELNLQEIEKNTVNKQTLRKELNNMVNTVKFRVEATAFNDEIFIMGRVASKKKKHEIEAQIKALLSDFTIYNNLRFDNFENLR